jgi:hypothetical protein
MRDFLLVVHVLAAAAWIGGSLFAGYSFSFLAAIRDLKTVKSVEEGTGGKFFGTAVVLMFLSGAALVIISDRFGWGHAFVLIGIGAIAVEGILEGAVVGPRLRSIAEAETQDIDRFRRELSMSTLAHLILFAFVVWAMVVKLGA